MFFVGEDLVLLTCGASFDVVRNPVVHPYTFCVSLGFADGFVPAGMSRCRVVVDEGHDESFLCVGRWGFFQSGRGYEFFGGMTAMPWLSSFPWSTPGGLNRASAGMFSLPGMCWMR